MIDEKKLKHSDLCDLCTCGDMCVYSPERVFKKWIDAQPKVGEWIPCSERLPDDLETVTVTWVNREPIYYYEEIKDKPFVDTAMRFKGKWYWWSVTLEDCLREYGQCQYDLIDEAVEITAWQPLPEPWEGEE